MSDENRRKSIVIFTYGPPCAGKTTFAKKFAEVCGFDYCGADEVRNYIYGSPDVYGDGNLIYRVILAKMLHSIKQGRDVIYDATNLRADNRYDYLHYLKHDIDAKDNNLRIIVKFDVGMELAKERHTNRGRTIPWESLEGYFYIKEPPSESEGWDYIIDYKNSNSLLDIYDLVATYRM